MDLPCTVFDCLSFNSEDFAVELDAECKATVCLRNESALSISGYEADGDCCELRIP